MKVSVIIPIYKVERFIRRCLDSIINQTYNNLEIIVVDDCSPDNSMAIVKEYASNDSRFVLSYNSRNLGLMMTRKNGYKIATGNYIMFVDSDDDLPLTAIEKLTAAITRNNCDIVAGTLLRIYVDGTVKELHSRLPYGNDRENVFRALLEKSFIHSLCGKIYNRRLFRDYEYEGQDDFTFGEDGFLFYQLVANSNKSNFIRDNVYNYYENTTSSTSLSTISISSFENSLRMDLMILKKCGQFPSLKRELNHYLVSDITKFFYLLKNPTSEILNLIDRYNLSRYCTVSQFFFSLSIKEQIKWFKAYFKSKIYMLNN